MALAIDSNNRTLKTREDLCVGEFRELADGATDKPVSTWRRLMPHGNSGGVVAGERFQFRIGTLRTSILTVVDWNLVILEEGYQQTHRIKEVNGSILTLAEPLDVFDGLSALGSNIAWCVYPVLDFPLTVHHISSTENNKLEIGFAKDLEESPGVVKYNEIDRDTTVVLPTRQIQNIFYKYTGTRTNADNADISMSWGEHYVRRS